ncbi:Uncharacterised protein g3311 [Pycnogonum litorale]
MLTVVMSSDEPNKDVSSQFEIHGNNKVNDSSQLSRVWRNETKDSLSAMKMSEIKAKSCQLLNVVRKVSSELVLLLQERDKLIQELDVRNVFIEQLLKLQSTSVEPCFNERPDDYYHDDYDSDHNTSSSS